MTTFRTAPGSPRLPHAVTTPAEAERLVIRLIDVMDDLLGVITKETVLVRAGRVHEAAQLARSITDHAVLYVALSTQLKASQPYLAATIPDIVAALRKRHDLFKALFQVNLTVLSSALGVSREREIATSAGAKQTRQASKARAA